MHGRLQLRRQGRVVLEGEAVGDLRWRDAGCRMHDGRRQRWCWWWRRSAWQGSWHLVRQRRAATDRASPQHGVSEAASSEQSINQASAPGRAGGRGAPPPLPPSSPLAARGWGAGACVQTGRRRWCRPAAGAPARPPRRRPARQAERGGRAEAGCVSGGAGGGVGGMFAQSPHALHPRPGQPKPPALHSLCPSRTCSAAACRASPARPRLRRCDTGLGAPPVHAPLLAAEPLSVPPRGDRRRGQ